jgi:hypothetical protein
MTGAAADCRGAWVVGDISALLQIADVEYACVCVCVNLHSICNVGIQLSHIQEIDCHAKVKQTPTVSYQAAESMAGTESCICIPVA